MKEHALDLLRDLNTSSSQLQLMFLGRDLTALISTDSVRPKFESLRLAFV
jgi:hypothetical protein